MDLPGIRYVVEFTDQTLANADGDVDLFALAPDAAGELVIVTSCLILPSGGTNDVGDAEEENVPCEWARAAAVGSGGSAFTPLPIPFGMPASSIAARTLDTTPAATATTLLPGSISSRTGYEWRPTPDESLMVFGGTSQDVLVFRITEGFADDIDFSGWLTFLELRG